MGIGKALLQRMAVIAHEQNCYGMRTTPTRTDSGRNRTTGPFS